ncbi:hypothetical protein [Streptomyces sp. 3214.6]|uniref:hypothetical protein n=1 Tax=Streptomyces sp. 3214.6 TaxID=1882757 RepID=UPI00090AC0B8|nr:hypothetical protein [Streptomyces sp. 3214.6]SHH85119.1 hypothetical protein SAMN05444521_2228 [Streptomyces sp. 3214.6]
MNYRERVAARIEELRAVPGVAVRQSEIRPPVAAAELAEARALADDRLPEGVEDFYTRLNGFTLAWDYTPPDQGGRPTDSGSIDILPLAEIFSDWRETIWFDDFPGGDRFEPVKPFDFFSPEACAAFCQQPDAPPGDEVRYHYLGEGLRPLVPSFPGYLELALLTCGYVGWHNALTLDDPAFPEAAGIRARMRQVVPGFSADKLTHFSRGGH